MWNAGPKSRKGRRRRSFKRTDESVDKAVLTNVGETIHAHAGLPHGLWSLADDGAALRVEAPAASTSKYPSPMIISHA